jgi:hypothetical protein
VYVCVLPSCNIESASRSGFEFRRRLGCLCLPYCRKHFAQHNKMQTRLVLQVGYGSNEYGQQVSSVLSQVRVRRIILVRLVKHTQADSLVVAPRVDDDHWASFFLTRKHFPCSTCLHTCPPHSIHQCPWRPCQLIKFLPECSSDPNQMCVFYSTSERYVTPVVRATGKILTTGSSFPDGAGENVVKVHRPLIWRAHTVLSLVEWQLKDL